MDAWLRVAAFRADAAWTRTPEFRAGASQLLEDCRATRTAIMCPEAVRWRCHRRIIADVMELEHGVEVLDLVHDGKLQPHEPSEGARLDREGHVVWDGAWS